MMYFLYHQKSGEFGIADNAGASVPLAVGYAGHGEGRNNPDKQDVRNVGPIPQGSYLLHDPVNHATVGPMAIKASASPGNKMFERSGFYIHGDNKANDASRGCIILPPAIRRIIAASGITRLSVVA